MIKVLILGVGGPAGINLVRCLRISNLPLQLMGTDVSPFRLQLPDLDARFRVCSCRDARYPDLISEIVRREHVALIFAQPDVEVLALARNRGYGAATALPDLQTITICQNKFETFLALQSQVGVPHTLPAYAVNAESFKALAVPTGKVWVRSRFGAGSHAAAPVTSLDEMQWWIGYCCRHKSVVADDFIAAEYLPGDDFAWQGIWYEGRFLGGVGRRRMEYAAAGLAPSGQSSSASLAVVVDDPRIESLGKAAVLALHERPTGSFGVDIKCKADGTPCVTEINAGRFYTTCNFHAACGMNLPHALLAASLGLPPPAFSAIQVGAMWLRSMDIAPKLLREQGDVQ